MVSTVADARMRDFDVVVPADCVATQSADRNRRALKHLEEVLDVRTTPGNRVQLDKPRG